MDIRAANPSVTGSSYNDNNMGGAETSNPAPPATGDVNAFNKAMESNGSACENCSGCPSCSGGEKSTDNSPLNDPQIKDTLNQIMQLLQQLVEQIGGSQSPKGGSSAGPGGGVNPVKGTGPGGSAPAGDGTIPKPTEHIQELNLGGKTVTVGGDGTASAEEIAQTAQSIEHMYQNSPTFKNMIDNSSDPSFEVSVGKRSDNTSWGNSNGRIFMNTNNVAPGNSDAWQSLLSHEFAHASIDLGHGGEMERLEEQAAREA